MGEEQQRIAAKILRLLLLQGGDCRADDYVEGNQRLSDLLDQYEIPRATDESRE